MYLLRAFADSHPLNRFSAIVGITLHSQELKDKIFQQFLADTERNPLVVTKPRFWSSMLDLLSEYWHYERFGIRNPKNMRWELPRSREIAHGMEAIRLIYEDQIERLCSGGFKGVYHEGNGHHPLKAYAIRNGVSFCDLDRKRYNVYLDPDEQKKREKGWIQLIRPSPFIDEELLVVGAKHTYNGYGLVTALEERGIFIRVEADYRDIDSKVRI